MQNWLNTPTGRMGTLGTRSVLHMLRLYHYGLELYPSGCRYYHVYEVTDKRLQNDGVDIYEEWIDGNGNYHNKAHEVKTERLTFQTLTDQRQPLTPWGEYVRGYLAGTGNMFCETVQGGCDGWFIKYKRSQARIEQEFTDGRSIWDVAYRPRERGIITEVDSIWSYDIFEDHTPAEIDGRRLYLLSRSDGFLMTEIPMQSFITVADRFISQHRQQLKHIEETNSDGYAIPWACFYREHTHTEGGEIVFGLDDQTTGARVFYDGDVWLREGKDIMQSWTDADFEPVDITINYQV